MKRIAPPIPFYNILVLFIPPGIYLSNFLKLVRHPGCCFSGAAPQGDPGSLPQKASEIFVFFSISAAMINHAVEAALGSARN